MHDDSEGHADEGGWNTSTAEHSVESEESDDAATRALVERLARRHPSGGAVIERAAILAEGADCTAVVAWIIAHEGRPEAAVAPKSRGLHGTRLSDPIGGNARPPVRYVLPAGALA